MSSTAGKTYCYASEENTALIPIYMYTYVYMHISYISLDKNHNFSIDPQVFQPVPRCGCGRHLAPRASSRRLLRRTRPAVQRATLGQGERFVEGRHQFFLEKQNATRNLSVFSLQFANMKFSYTLKNSYITI